MQSEAQSFSYERNGEDVYSISPLGFLRITTVATVVTAVTRGCCTGENQASAVVAKTSRPLAIFAIDPTLQPQSSIAPPIVLCLPGKTAR